MAVLKLFGVEWPLQGETIRAPSGAAFVEGEGFSGTFRDGTVTLRGGLDDNASPPSWRMVVSLSFAVTQGASGALIPLDSERNRCTIFFLSPIQEAIPDPPINVWLGGGLRISARAVPPNDSLLVPVVRGSELWIQIKSTAAFDFRVDFRAAPFKMRLASSAAFTLDLQQSKLVCDSGFFDLDLGIRAPDDKRTLYSAAAFRNRLTDVKLGGLTGQQFRFAPTDPDRPWPLGASPVEGMNGGAFRAPMTLTQTDIEITFDAATSGAKLRDLRGRPAQAGGKWQLTAHRLRNRRNTPAVMTGAADIPLSYREARNDQAESGAAICGTFFPRPGAEIAGLQLSEKLVHTRLAGTEFRIPPNSQLSLRFEPIYTANPGARQDPLFADESSLPWLSVAGDDCRIFAPRPGVCYVGSGALSRIETRGRALAIPLIEEDDLPPRRRSGLTVLKNRLDGEIYKLHRVELPAARHETGFTETPAAQGLIAIRGVLGITDPGRKSGSQRAGVLLDHHKVEHDYGPLQASFERGGVPGHKSSIEYGLITSPQDLAGKLDFSLDVYESTFVLAAPDATAVRGAKWAGSKSPVLAIVKYGHQFKLEDILAREGVDLTSLAPAMMKRQSSGLFDKLFDPIINRPEWVGLIVFNVPVTTNLKLLNDVMPADAVAQYVAIRPHLAGGTPNANARFWWQEDPVTEDPKDDLDSDQEATYRIKGIDARIRDSALSYFNLDSTLQLNRFFGRSDVVKQPIALRGRIERVAGVQRIRIGGALETPVRIFEKDLNAGPVSNVFFKGAEIIASGDSSRISIDGHVELRKMDLGGISLDPDGTSLLNFFDLGLDLSALGANISATLKKLSFSYPSLRFDFEGPKFRLWEQISVGLSGLGFDWNVAHAWANVVRMKIGDWTGGGVYFDLKFDFGSLPQLALGGLSRLKLGLRIGCRRGVDWNPDALTLAISALDFKPFKLGLLRFLELGADRICAQPTNGAVFKSPLIQVEQAYLEVLGTRIVTGLNAGFGVRTTNGAKAFYLASERLTVPAAVANYFKLDWLLIAREVSLPRTFVNQLLEIPSPAMDDDAQIRGTLQQAGSALFEGDDARPWLFAAGVTVLDGFLNGRVLVQDGGTCGASLWGEKLEQLLGLKLAITALYIKRARREEDSFFVSLKVPRVLIGTIQFTGGVVDFEFFTNSDFMFDAGFPRLLEGGGRDWNRALGAIVTPFQGNGGFYLAKRTTSRLSMSSRSGQKFLRLSSGYAVQAGLGATFGNGLITAWVTVGIYVVAEGDALLCTDGGSFEPWGISLTGAVGILIRGGAELDWWIISIRLEVIAQAEARIAITWGEVEVDLLKPIAIGAQKLKKPPGEVLMKLAFELYFSASARACIGKRPFRVCRGVSVKLSMPVQHTLRLAKL